MHVPICGVPLSLVHTGDKIDLTRSILLKSTESTVRTVDKIVRTVNFVDSVDSIDSTGDIKSKSILSPVCTRPYGDHRNRPNSFIPTWNPVEPVSHPQKRQERVTSLTVWSDQLGIRPGCRVSSRRRQQFANEALVFTWGRHAASCRDIWGS